MRPLANFAFKVRSLPCRIGLVHRHASQAKPRLRFGCCQWVAQFVADGADNTALQQASPGHSGVNIEPPQALRSKASRLGFNRSCMC